MNNLTQTRRLDAARQIVRTLMEHGYEAYFVGGFVRDSLLGKPTTDIDIATSATPTEVCALFSHTVATGLQHGTVSVIMERVAYEVTTFRTESTYQAARRPEQVTFIRDVQQDLQRRDFTINAMALDVEGRIIDPYAGQVDLQQRVIRAVGDPQERFAEDALRMLRCIRFSSVLDFSIAPTTWAALLRQRSSLQLISIERIRMELEKMLEGPQPTKALALLAESQLLQEVKITTEWKQAMARLTQPITMDANIMSEASARWAYWLRILGCSAELAKEICRALTHSNKKTQEIVDALRFLEDLNAATSSNAVQPADIERIWKCTAIRYERQIAELVWQMLSNATNCQSQQTLWLPGQQYIYINGQNWLAAMPIFTTKQLAVNGKSLIQYFAKPSGPWLRTLLHDLLERVVLLELPNEAQALLEYAERYLAGEHS